MPTPDDHLRDLFDRAAEVADPAARAALLDQECGDPALRERVEVLLRAHDAAGSFLEQSPLATSAETVNHVAQDTSATPNTGQRLESGGIIDGRYKLLEEIGEGGMGTVWMAEQIEPVKRRVAIKLIKPGMDSRQVLARFEAERQALALMDHPNIARVLDCGATADGRPYFVMELVKGTPITAFCDDKHLPLAERLKLFADVCRAVQHAHQKGIIHRDLKPSNVLVAPYDGKPVVKVIDFGVAKAAGLALTERTLFTGFGAVVGTPEYMSPEQAELNNQDIDTRSDIYSLGILLYELLTGATPLTRARVKQAALLEILRLVREEEPARPSTRLSTTDELPSIAAVRGIEPAKLSKLVRGELDWIVMKALEKDRSRRYETANGLAADVDRYLSGEPVQAVPPSAAYRLRKALRRHRAAAVVVAAFVLLLAAGAATSTYFALAASARARESDANAATANRNAEAARKNLDKARAAVDRMLFRVAEEKLSEMPQLEGLRKKLLEDALQFNEELLAAAGDDRALRRDAAISRAQLAHVSFMFGRPDEAKARQAVDLLEELLREDPTDRAVGWKLVLYRCYFHHQLVGRGDKAEAERQLREAVELGERLYREAPQEADIPLFVATYSNLGGFLKLAGRPDEAETWLRKTVDLARKQRVHQQEGNSLRWLGQILEERQRPQEAREAYEAAIRAFDQQATEIDNRMLWSERGWVLHDLSRVVRAAGEEDRANALLAEAAQLYAQVTDRFPQYRAQRTSAIDLHRELARYVGRKDAAAADTWFRKAADRAAALAHAWPSELEFLRLTFEVQAERAWAWRAAGRDGDVREVLRQLGEFLKGRAADPACANALPLELARLFLDLATLAAELGDSERAEKARREGAARLERLKPSVQQGSDKPDRRRALAAAYAVLGLSYSQARQHQEAIQACNRGIEAWSADPRSWIHRGRARAALGEHDKVLADISKAIELGEGDAGLPWWHLERAKTYRVLKQDDKALAELTLATERWPGLWDTWVCRADFHRDCRRWTEAAADFSRALELNPKAGGLWHGRGVAYLRLGRWAEATADLSKALELSPAGPFIDVGQLHNDMAWLLATCPDEKFRNPAEAVRLAKRAAEFAPRRAAYWNTLGVSHYRAREYREAVTALEKSMELRKGGDAFNWFFLAMAQWRLGNKDEACRWYDQAVEWTGKNAPKNDELIRFRADAADLLGLSLPSQLAGSKSKN